MNFGIQKGKTIMNLYLENDCLISYVETIYI